MPFNLPPPWNPGFALPDNVRDEGIERRAFVSKQMPRGTYDDETDGTGGYAVPSYVLDEGTGQGTFTTKWMPSGTYVGPKVKHWLNQRPRVLGSKKFGRDGREFAVQPLGDDEPFPAPIANYGQRAAQAILGRIAVLPVARRQEALKAILDRIDRSLWGRSQEIWRRYVGQGMPPGMAASAALARALSAGIAAEIITTGLKGAAPQANSLLGLGCYGARAALGADEPVAMCAPPAGFTWVAPTTDVPGHWEKLRKGATPVNGPCDPATGKAPVPQVGDHRVQYLQVGPFAFNPNVTRYWRPGHTGADAANIAAAPDIVVTDPARLPADWSTWINKELTSPIDEDGHTDKMVTDYVGPNAPAAYGYPEADAIPWFQKFGIDPGTTPVRLHVMWGFRVGAQPLAKLKHPTTGDDLVLHMVLAKKDRTKDWDATTNPTVLKLYLTKVGDMGLFASFWKSLFTLIGAIRDVAADALNELGDLACDLISGPTGQLAGAAVAGAAGAPPQAGVVGATIAQGACGAKPPPPVPIVPASGSGLIPMLLVGGAVVAVYALTSKKKP